MHRSPRSISSSQSPTDVHDRGREREHEYETEHVERRHVRQESSRSPPPSVPARSAQARVPHQGLPTALPSIHHLHPDLPPPHAHRHAAPAQQYSPSEFLPGTSYGPSSAFFAGSQRSPALAHASSTYPHPPSYDERRASFDRPPPPGPGARPLAQQATSTYHEQYFSPPEAESDQEQNDSERGPPKKKRRRQALSCTECKRRKIKCDRTRPCGPCSRRSEPDKCQWHVIEPVDKYVTRSEWDELFARYRVLEDRCIRLERLIVQLHPEITENSQYEIATGNLTAMSSPSAKRPTAIATRTYALAGPGIAGAGASSSVANQRVTPNTPLSALPGPGPSPRSGPGAGVSALPVGTSTGAESSASTRSGSAPPPMFATTHSAVPQPPSHSDRRTSASGSHASFAAASERSVPPYQVPSSEMAPSAHVRPFTAPSPRSYMFAPPPPPPEDAPRFLSTRGRRDSIHERSSAVPESPSVSTPRAYAVRSSARPFPSPLSSVSGGGHMHSDDTAAEMDVDVRYAASRYEPEHRHERSVYERPVTLPQRHGSDSKNGEAQTFEAGDVLRQSWSASPACEHWRTSSPRESLPAPGPASSISRSALNSRPHANPVYAHSGDSTPSSPHLNSSETPTPSHKRERHGSLYLNIPSAPDTPPPVLVH